MEEPQNLEVKLISTQIVKPSSPTLRNKNSLTLSFLDQSFPAVTLPALIVYTNSAPVDTVTNLKTSLSETLTTFYPLAGRCENLDTVSCNDEGVPYRETRVNCRVTDLLNSPKKLDLFVKFLPPIDLFSFGNCPVSDFPPLSFQVNLFECGGIVIGCYFFHKLLDASSLACFFNNWAAVASKRYSDLVHPDFSATVTTFPPPLKVMEVELAPPPAEGGGDKGGSTNLSALWHSLKSIKVVGKNFIFTRPRINKLKSMAATDTLPNPTGFEAVAGFLWHHIATSANPKTEDSVPTVLSFSANIRSRTNPKLPKSSMGNLIVDIHACSKNCIDFPDNVREIHSAIQTVQKKVEEMQGENGVKAFLAEREAGFRGYVDDINVANYTLSSWCKLGFDGVDFGFGKPSKVIPVGMMHPFLKNSMGFVDYSDVDGDGIEVWLFLEENEMNVLVSNDGFSAFVVA
ncbi:hypothetical protein RND81_13G022600 [Saponaria officinalis]|uniref:Uncharacterized protein n=1 Tax=Saponaria officinalis TaxID=3572 RepID=A0AAW1GYM6_SAPOF